MPFFGGPFFVRRSQLYEKNHPIKKGNEKRASGGKRGRDWGSKGNVHEFLLANH